RDLWPASIVTVGAMKKGFFIRMLERLELFLYRRARAIVAVTKSFKEDLIRRGIDGTKIHVVRNGVDLNRYQPRPADEAFARELGVEEKFVIAYLGTHGMAHALDNVLCAANLLEAEPSIVFLLVGDGAEKQSLVAKAEELQLKNVVFHDSMPKNRMPALWSVADVALVHLRDDPVFATVIPSKIFEAFGMGKPVMMVLPDGEAAGIVRDAGAGVWVPPEDPQALADSVIALQSAPQQFERYSTMAANAAKEHSRDELAKRMEEILRHAAHGP
ncbi:MAG: glycosyltransferase family 4 protein, partial [Gammaproteobacteria bacterium]|nr:glycosyltransferase family 4 protein [Gammaproteobacteria bacterium]